MAKCNLAEGRTRSYTQLTNTPSVAGVRYYVGARVGGGERAVEAYLRHAPREYHAQQPCQTSTLNPKPYTLNSQHRNLHPKPQTRKSKNPKTFIESEPRALDYER